MRSFGYVLLFLLAALKVSAQDTIVKKSNEIILGKVVEVGDTEINFKRQTNLNGPIYVIQIADISMIKYESGAKDIFNTSDTPKAVQNQAIDEPVKEIPQQEPLEEQNPETVQNQEEADPPQLQNPYIQGQMDAQKYYKKYKAAGITTLISTTMAPFEFGLAAGAVKAVLVAVILSVKTPKVQNLDIPNPAYRSNPQYMAGYRDGALRKKRKRIFINFIYPAAVYISLFAGGIIR